MLMLLSRCRAASSLFFSRGPNRALTDFAAAADRLLPALIGGAVLYGVSIRGARRATRGRLLQTWFAYMVLMLAAWFWLDRVQQTAPGCAS